MEELTQTGGHGNTVESLVALGRDLVFYLSFNREPVKYFQDWSSAFMLWFMKDESGSIILYALKLCKFVIRKASQKRITIIKMG